MNRASALWPRVPAAALYPLRIALYGFVSVLLFETLYLGVQRFGAETIGAENGPVELSQVALLTLGAIAYFAAASRTPIGRFGLVLGGAALTYAAARESDTIFEQLFFDDAYKWLVGVPAAIFVLFIAWVQRDRWWKESLDLMRQPSGTLFSVAAIFLLAVCHPLDRPDFWSSISNSGQALTTKAMFEEYAELFAYLLMAVSGIEAAIAAEGRRGEVQELTVADDRPAGEKDCTVVRRAA